jgi:hypothetical protein
MLCLGKLAVTHTHRLCHSSGVSRRLTTAVARVRAEVRCCGILFVDKVAQGQVFSEYFGFPASSHSTDCSTLIIYRPCRYNRPVSGRRTKLTQFHPAPKKLKKETYTYVISRFYMWNETCIYTDHLRLRRWRLFRCFVGCRKSLLILRIFMAKKTLSLICRNRSHEEKSCPSHVILEQDKLVKIWGWLDSADRHFKLEEWTKRLGTSRVPVTPCVL